jgi:hypothetical protein
MDLWSPFLRKYLVVLCCFESMVPDLPRLMGNVPLYKPFHASR